MDSGKQMVKMDPITGIMGFALHRIRRTCSPPQQGVQCPASTRPDMRLSGTSAKGPESPYAELMSDISVFQNRHCVCRDPHMGINGRRQTDTDIYIYGHKWTQANRWSKQVMTTGIMEFALKGGAFIPYLHHSRVGRSSTRRSADCQADTEISIWA